MKLSACGFSKLTLCTCPESIKNLKHPKSGPYKINSLLIKFVPVTASPSSCFLDHDEEVFLCVLCRGVAHVNLAGIIRKVGCGGHGRDMQYFLWHAIFRETYDRLAQSFMFFCLFPVPDQAHPLVRFRGAVVIQFKKFLLRDDQIQSLKKRWQSDINWGLSS